MCLPALSAPTNTSWLVTTRQWLWRTTISGGRRGAGAAWNPSASGWNVDFIDVQITLDSSSTARAYLTVEVTTSDPRTGQPVVDAREAMVGLAEREGIWVITTAEPAETLQRP